MQPTKTRKILAISFGALAYIVVFLDTIYILSNSAYGTIESQKILAFGSQITGENHTISGVPQRFVWNLEERKYELVGVN